MDNKNFGVIQEQGFVLGSGLGFKSLNEEEKKSIETEEEKKEK